MVPARPPGVDTEAGLHQQPSVLANPRARKPWSLSGAHGSPPRIIPLAPARLPVILRRRPGHALDPRPKPRRVAPRSLFPEGVPPPHG